MPLSKTSKKVLKSMQKTYGDKKGEQVFYATAAKKTGKQGQAEKAGTWKDTKGGFDRSQYTCPHCHKKMKRFGPKRGAGYTYNPDQEESNLGAYACTNPDCSFIEDEEKNPTNRPWFSTPIVNEMTVSKGAEVMFDGEKYLLEVGDKIVVECKTCGCSDVAGGAVDSQFNAIAAEHLKNMLKHPNLSDEDITTLRQAYLSLQDHVELGRRYEDVMKKYDVLKRAYIKLKSGKQKKSEPMRPSEVKKSPQKFVSAETAEMEQPKRRSAPKRAPKRRRISPALARSRKY